LIWFAIRQLHDAWSKKPLGIAASIWPWFVLSCVANMWWILAWHHLYIWLSLFLMVVILISLIVISQKVKTWIKRWDWRNKLFSQIPFGVYLGWISVATIANVSTLLVDMQWNMWWMSDVFWTVMVLIVATLLWLLQLIKSSNVPFVLVLLRAFYGILMKRISIDPAYASSIIWTLGLCSIILSWFLWWRWQQWLRN
jgi:hypothetical protein